MKKCALIFLVLLCLCLCAATAYAQGGKPALVIADASDADLTPYLPDYARMTGLAAPEAGETPSVVIEAKWAGEGELAWSVTKPKKVVLREVEGEPLKRRVVWLTRPEGAKNASLSVTVTVTTPDGKRAKRAYRFGYRPGTIRLTSNTLDKTVTPNQSVLTPGAAPVTIKAEIWPAPAKYGVGKKFTWTSSDPSVAAVGKKTGKVSAATDAKGSTALITATHVKSGMIASQLVAVKGRALDAVLAPPSFENDPELAPFVHAEYKEVTYVDAAGARRTVKALTKVDWNAVGNPEDCFYVSVNPLSGAARAKDEYAGPFGRVFAASDNEDAAVASVVRDNSSPHYGSVRVDVKRPSASASATIDIRVWGTDPSAAPISMPFTLNVSVLEVAYPNRLVIGGPASIIKGQAGNYAVSAYQDAEPLSTPIEDTVWTVTPDAGSPITYTGAAYQLDTLDEQFQNASGAQIEARLTLFPGTAHEQTLAAQKLSVVFSELIVPTVNFTAYPQYNIAGDGSADAPYILPYAPGDTLTILTRNLTSAAGFTATCQVNGGPAAAMTTDVSANAFILENGKFAPGDLLTVSITKGANAPVTIRVAIPKAELAVVAPVGQQTQDYALLYDLSQTPSLSVEARSLFPANLTPEMLSLACRDNIGPRGSVSYANGRWTVKPGDVYEAETLSLIASCGKRQTKIQTLAELDVTVCADSAPTSLDIAPHTVPLDVATPIVVRLLSQYGTVIREIPCGAKDPEDEIMSDITSQQGTVDSGTLTLTELTQTASATASFLNLFSVNRTIIAQGLSCRLETAELSLVKNQAVFRVADLPQALSAGTVAVYKTVDGKPTGSRLSEGSSPELRTMDITGMYDASFSVAAFLNGVRISEDLTVSVSDMTISSLAIEPTSIHYGVETVIYAVAKNTNGIELGRWTMINNDTRLSVTILADDGYVTLDGILWLNTLNSTAKVSATWKGSGVTTGEVTITATRQLAESISFTVAAAQPDFTAPDYRQNTSLCVGETNMRLYFYALDKAGKPFPLAQTDYVLESSNTDILTVGTLDANNSAALTAVSTGSAHVSLKDSKGTIIVSYPITVKAQRKEATLSLDKSSVSIWPDGSGSAVTATVKDQYGDAMPVDLSKIQVSLTGAGPAQGSVSATPAKTANGMAFTILFKANGYVSNGTFAFDVTYDTLPACAVRVTVTDPPGSTTA